MADYLKLFHAKRLTAKEPHHLEYIKGRLAALKVEDPKAYEEFSTHYGVDLTVTIEKEPKPELTDEEKAAKKAAREAKKALKLPKASDPS